MNTLETITDIIEADMERYRLHIAIYTNIKTVLKPLKGKMVTKRIVPQLEKLFEEDYDIYYSTKGFSNPKRRELTLRIPADKRDHRSDYDESFHAYISDDDGYYYEELIDKSNACWSRGSPESYRKCQEALSNPMFLKQFATDMDSYMNRRETFQNTYEDIVCSIEFPSFYAIQKLYSPKGYNSFYGTRDR